MRETPRSKFKPNDEKIVTISFDNELTHGARQSLRFKAVDIAENGMCVLISDNNKNIIEKSERLILTHLGNYELPEPIAIEKKYINRIRYRSKGRNVIANRSGLKFETPLSAQYIDLFVNTNQ
jgi:hypothetical protein